MGLASCNSVLWIWIKFISFPLPYRPLLSVFLYSKVKCHLLTQCDHPKTNLPRDSWLALILLFLNFLLFLNSADHTNKYWKWSSLIFVSQITNQMCVRKRSTENYVWRQRIKNQNVQVLGLFRLSYFNHQLLQTGISHRTLRSSLVITYLNVLL